MRSRQRAQRAANGRPEAPRAQVPMTTCAQERARFARLPAPPTLSRFRPDFGGSSSLLFFAPAAAFATLLLTTVFFIVGVESRKRLCALRHMIVIAII